MQRVWLARLANGWEAGTSAVGRDGQERCETVKLLSSLQEASAILFGPKMLSCRSNLIASKSKSLVSLNTNSIDVCVYMHALVT